MTKTILMDKTNLSLSTIKNYLKKNSELNEIYISIKETLRNFKAIRKQRGV